eukprot:TRINITY_DN16849_c0_g1_i1.p1 TRINITY_DN16849_c0_g1~~TRINITY_DN16849_c0_g1_i1.p1  ORF type:complete len:1103 (+),score=332.06 TRINITY_DN16849_c0_g1_i1:89-3397(+)
MAYDSEGLFTGLVLNAVIFLVLHVLGYWLWHTGRLGGVLLFKVYRPRRPDEKPTFWKFSGTDGLASLRASIFRLRDPWVDCCQTPEARMYLTYLRLMIVLFGSIGIVCPLCLIPINVTAEYRETLFYTDTAPNQADAKFNPGVADWTTRNIEPESARLWGLTLVSIYVFYEVVAAVLKLTRELQAAKLNTVPPDTAQLYNIPGATKAEAEQHIWSQLPTDLRGKDPATGQYRVKHITVPEAAPPDMLDKISERQTLIDELRYWYAFCQKEGISLKEPGWETHEDLEIRPAIGAPFVNAIVHFREELTDLEDQLEQLVADVADPAQYNEPVGTAFVTFHSSDDCARFVLAHSSKKSVVEKVLRIVPGVRRSDVWFAPEPYCILWNNLGLHRWQRVGRAIVVYATLIGLGSVWALIIGVLGNVDNIADWVDPVESVMEIHPEVRGLASAYLPVLVLALLNALLPFFLRPFITHVEKPPDKVARETRLMQCMTNFGLVTAVLVQSALQGGGDSILVFEDRSLREILLQMIVPSNGYFSLQVLSAACVGNMVTLLKPIDVILGALLNVMGLTQKDMDEAYEKRAFFFSEEYSLSLINFGFAFLFCVNVPFIPTFGFFYFIIKFLVDRSLLTDAYPQARESSLACVALCIRSLLVILLVWLCLGVTALLFIRRRYDCAVASCGTVAACLIIIRRVHTWLLHIMGPKIFTDRDNIPKLPRLLAWAFGEDLLSPEAESVASPTRSPQTRAYVVLDDGPPQPGASAAPPEASPFFGLPPVLTPATTRLPTRTPLTAGAARPSNFEDREPMPAHPEAVDTAAAEAEAEEARAEKEMNRELYALGVLSFDDEDHAEELAQREAAVAALAETHDALALGTTQNNLPLAHTAPNLKVSFALPAEPGAPLSSRLVPQPAAPRPPRGGRELWKKVTCKKLRKAKKIMEAREEGLPTPEVTPFESPALGPTLRVVVEQLVAGKTIAELMKDDAAQAEADEAAPSVSESDIEDMPDFVAMNGRSRYSHPCTLYRLIRTKHEKQAEKEWLVAQNLSTNRPSRRILKQCVFFPGPFEAEGLSRDVYAQVHPGVKTPAVANLEKGVTAPRGSAEEEESFEE